MPYVRTKEAEIHYTVAGEGHPLLLITGLGANEKEWGEAFPGKLAERFCVIRMDNRGAGESRAHGQSWSMLNMAEDACAVLDALDVQSTHLIGTSMGGMIAQEFALQFGERVRRLVLIATHMGGAECVGPEPQAAALFGPQPGLSANEIRRHALGVITGPGFPERHPEVIEQMVVLRERWPPPPLVFKAQLEAIMLSDRSQAVARIRTPTLVLHGKRDALVPAQNGVLLAQRIPGARLVLLENCGHLPYVEQPAECAEVVLEFLGEAS